MKDFAQAIDYKELAQAMLASYKDIVSSTPTASYGHGPGGLFSYPGLERPVFSAMVMPIMGLQGNLPVRSSRDANPLYSIFTGVTASSGSEPVGVCDDPPYAGLAKLCTHTAPFGRQARQTRVFELDRMGLWTNRGEFGDLQFVGDPFNVGKYPHQPTIQNTMDAVLRNEVNKALFELGIAWNRDFAREIYTGNPANNTAGGGRKYAYGLDILINTNRRDAITGQLCPAADSIIVSFGGADITTSQAAQTSIVRWITNITRRLKMIASTTGLDPVRWAIVMRENLFYELTAVWPCSYQTYRCSLTQPGGVATNVAMSDRKSLNDMTDSLRTDKKLLIDGEYWDVVIDNAITETVMAGESFRSPIYFVPLTVVGGTPVTILEYVDYDSPMGAMEAAKTFAPDGMYYTSDNGRFLWHKKVPDNFCVQLMAKTEPRLLLLTPHLAARLTLVQYTPLAHERDWNTDSSFYVNGGRTDFNGYPASFYSPVYGY